jgi:hypothetical protein
MTVTISDTMWAALDWMDANDGIDVGLEYLPARDGSIVASQPPTPVWGKRFPIAQGDGWHAIGNQPLTTPTALALAKRSLIIIAQHPKGSATLLAHLSPQGADLVGGRFSEHN